MNKEIAISTENRRLKEHCALFGIIQENVDQKIHLTTYRGLTAQQHRGEEAWGFAWINAAGRISRSGDLGLLTGVPEQKIKNILATRSATSLALGHLRYSAVGKREDQNKEKDKNNIQPFVFGGKTPFAIAHNGTVQFEYPVGENEPDSDTYRVGKAISEGKGDFEQKTIEVLSKLNGAYTFLFLTRDGLYLARDPWRFRPAILGRIEGNSPGFILVSESVALRAVRARATAFPRRGVFAKIETDGLHEIWRDPRVNLFPAAECTFEKAYFADAASEHEDERTNHEIRVSLGKRIAERVKPKGDFVMAVPRSGHSYAKGVSQYAGIPLEDGIQDVRHKIRTFTQPGDSEERTENAFQKYRFIKNLIKGKRLIVVDDSIVRGHTTKELIDTLFSIGAERIELLSGIPPIKDICKWGIDFPDINELIHHKLMNGGPAEEYERKFSLWLVGGDEKRAKRLRVSFQRLEDYIGITQNAPLGTSIEHSGGCFHCVSGIAPKGTIYSLPDGR